MNYWLDNNENIYMYKLQHLRDAVRHSLHMWQICHMWQVCHRVELWWVDHVKAMGSMAELYMYMYIISVTKFVFTYASRKRDQQLIKSTRQIWKGHNFSKPVNLFYPCQISAVSLPAVKPFSRQNPRYLPLNGKSALRYFNFFFFDDLFCLAKKVWYQLLPN